MSVPFTHIAARHLSLSIERYLPRRSGAIQRPPRRKPMPEMKEVPIPGIRETLQSLEDKLIENGWEQITVHTEHGLFIWRTDEREEEIEEEEDDGDFV